MLHPVLVALFIVLTEDHDLGSINRAHPEIGDFKYYDRDAEFPETLSMLPGGPPCWWERLGASN